MTSYVSDIMLNPCLNPVSDVNGVKRAYSNDGNSNYPTVQVHAILKLSQNDKVNSESSGSIHTGAYNVGGDENQFQVFEGYLLSKID